MDRLVYESNGHKVSGWHCDSCGDVEADHEHELDFRKLRVANGASDVIEAPCRICHRWASAVCPPVSDFDFGED